jgi:hypothetical protein
MNPRALGIARAARLSEATGQHRLMQGCLPTDTNAATCAPANPVCARMRHLLLVHASCIRLGCLCPPANRRNHVRPAISLQQADTCADAKEGTQGAPCIHDLLQSLAALHMLPSPTHAGHMLPRRLELLHARLVEVAKHH